jgi:hypothetical protein
VPSYGETRIPGLQRKVADLGKRRAQQDATAAKEEAAAIRYDREAERTKSPSLAKSKRGQAERARDNMAKARKKAAGLLEDLSKVQKDLADTEGRVAKKREADAKRREYQEKRERDKADARRKREEREQKRRERETQRRDDVRQQEIADLRARTTNVEARLQRQAPDKITVLFVAASPEDIPPLRLDKELREIQKRFRESGDRESIKFEIRMATQLTDLLQMLNEVRPHIVHFSGHGAQEGLFFEDSDGKAKLLTPDRLANLLNATSDRIRLALFNSCNSSDQAALACEHLEAAIGMDAPVSDEAAKLFAGQFYNALGFGKSVQQAFDQAVFQMHTAGAALSKPRLHVANGTDPSLLFLVAPPEMCE